MERMLAEEVDRRQLEWMTANTALLILEYLCTGNLKKQLWTILDKISMLYN